MRVCVCMCVISIHFRLISIGPACHLLMKSVHSSRWRSLRFGFNYDRRHEQIHLKPDNKWDFYASKYLRYILLKQNLMISFEKIINNLGKYKKTNFWKFLKRKKRRSGYVRVCQIFCLLFRINEAKMIPVVLN